MGKKIRSLLLGITVLSLSLLLLVLAASLLKNSLFVTKGAKNAAAVLGEKTYSPVDLYLNDTIGNTKELFSEKASSVQKKIVDTLEKETSDFAKSQINEIQLKICTQWGIITPSLPKR